MSDLRAKLLLAVGATLVSAVLVALVGEWAVRYRERNRTSVPGTISMLYYEHARLGHALVRGTDYFGWMQVNRQGFRGPAVSVDPADSVTRIMVVGASTTFDTQVGSNERTWVARLQHWLDQDGRPGQVEVINAGTPGYEVIDNLARLEYELYRFRPDVAVLYHGHNDISCALSGRSRVSGDDPQRPNQVEARTPWVHWLEQRSLLYNKVAVAAKWMFLRRQAGQAPDSAKTGAPVLDPWACGPDQFERDVTLFTSAARALGIRVVLAPVVHVSGAGAVQERDEGLRARWIRARPYAEPDSALRLYNRYNAILRQVAERESVPLIETGSFGLSGPEFYAPMDPMHFNDEGADVMGRAFAEALINSRALDLAVSATTR